MRRRRQAEQLWDRGGREGGANPSNRRIEEMFTLDIVYRIRGIGRNWVCQMTFMHIKLFSNMFMADFNDMEIYANLIHPMFIYSMICQVCCDLRKGIISAYCSSVIGVDRG
jgi:hypothetical protein